jgi:hypothetical protein
MQHQWGQRIRCGFLAVCLMGMVVAPASAQAFGLIPLAQATPPAPAPGTPLPPNVTVPGRLYVMEGIVVVLLFAGAVFGVCRASGRT